MNYNEWWELNKNDDGSDVSIDAWNHLQKKIAFFDSLCPSDETAKVLYHKLERAAEVLRYVAGKLTSEQEDVRQLVLDTLGKIT